MNHFASHNPELYEQMVERHGTIEEAFRANADALRDREKYERRQAHAEAHGHACTCDAFDEDAK